MRTFIVSFILLIGSLCAETEFVVESCENEDIFKGNLNEDCQFISKLNFESDKQCSYYKVKCSFTDSKLIMKENRGPARSIEAPIKVIVDEPADDMVPKDLFQIRASTKYTLLNSKLSYAATYYRQQFNLLSKGDISELGFDMNVILAQSQGFTGRNTSVFILDDGIEVRKKAFIGRLDSSRIYNFSTDPIESEHGTAVSSLAIGNGNFDTCIAGVSTESKVSFGKVMGNGVLRSSQAEALSKNAETTDVYNCSWGPDDDGTIVAFLPDILKNSLSYGVRRGRNGLGSVYVWATGNGGPEDSCGADGYSGNEFTISASSVNELGGSASYNEACGHITISAYVGERYAPAEYMGLGCYTTFAGTSAAAPLITGCVSLLLQANQKLTWRDVHTIVKLSGRLPQMAQTIWQVNGAGHFTSEQLGFGVMDCARGVRLAKSWNNIGPLCLVTTRYGYLPTTWTDFGYGPLTSQYTLDQVNNYIKNYQREMEIYGSKDNVYEFQMNSSGKYQYAAQQNRASLDGTTCQSQIMDWIMIKVELIVQCRGSLTITLESPSRTEGLLLKERLTDTTGGPITLKMKSNQFFGERTTGTWKLKIKDSGICAGTLVNNPGTTNLRGILVGFTIDVYSTSESDSYYTKNRSLVDQLLLTQGKSARALRRAKKLTLLELETSIDESKNLSLDEGIPNY